MRGLRAVFADLGLIGLAIVFGWAIWYTVREDLNETQRRTIQIVFEPELGLDVSPRSQSVRLEVQGPRRAVEALVAAPATRVVRRVSLSDLPPGADETRRDFSKDDLDFSEAFGGSSLTVLEMNPPVVSVRAFVVEEREKTVSPPEFIGAAELGIKHVLQGYTNLVVVRGAKSALDDFREIRTVVSKEYLQGFAASLRDSPKTVARLVLEIDPAQKELFTLVKPTELSARVELSRIAEQELIFPIEIYATAGARGPRRLQFAELNKPHFVPGDPPKVKLLFTGAPNALAALTTSKIHAFVLAGDLPEDQRNGDVPVHVADLPPGIALTQDYSVYVEETR